MKEGKYFLKVFLGTIGLFVLTVLLLYLFINRDNPVSYGSKKITIQVIVPDEDVQEFTLYTDAITLREALDEKEMIRGLNSSYGFYITTVNGIRADETREEWWSLTKNGEYVEYGVDMIHIQDKDKYELTLMKGY
ncbi:MAG: DUF4430 domain-containing protein [Clostridiales bacterium]|nr:DUF4430 domain-containing protein [Clostridiales bacterium]